MKNALPFRDVCRQTAMRSNNQTTRRFPDPPAKLPQLKIQSNETKQCKTKTDQRQHYDCLSKCTFLPTRLQSNMTRLNDLPPIEQPHRKKKQPSSNAKRNVQARANCFYPLRTHETHLNPHRDADATRPRNVPGSDIIEYWTVLT